MFIECQTIIRKVLKSPPNPYIKSLWADTSYGTKLQYDQFQNTKQVLKAVQHEHEGSIKNTLLTQGLVISSILKHSCQRTTSIWSIAQQNLPRNIFNFSIKYLNNTLPTRKNLCKWSISQASACSFCLHSETLQHVVSRCKCISRMAEILGPTTPSFFSLLIHFHLLTKLSLCRFTLFCPRL